MPLCTGSERHRSIKLCRAPWRKNLLGQLLGDGIEALADMGLVFVRSIPDHIVAVHL